jgi:hypothetical protein
LNRSILRALVDHGAAVTDADMQAKLKTLLERPADEDA